VIKLEVLAVEPVHVLSLALLACFCARECARRPECRCPHSQPRARASPSSGSPCSLVLDPIHFLMQRRMMLGIRELAEAKTVADRTSNSHGPLIMSGSSLSSDLDF